MAHAVWIRTTHLGCAPFWVDEAESSLNALSILDHGYPVGKYLGLPMYENTLIAPWPESVEYEFRDLSYSRNGAAVYHGWLPLYSMAASFALAGIEPDPEVPGLEVRRTIEEDRMISAVARIPSVLYGILLIGVLVWGAWGLGGAYAGAAALILCAYFAPIVAIARIARYLSASVTLGALCGLLAWRVIERGRWRDYLLTGLFFVTLFHTHLATFVVVGATFATSLPGTFGRDRSLLKLGAAGLVLAVGVIPWVVFTGFREHLGTIPFAWSLLSLRDAFLAPVLFQKRLALTVLATVLLSVGVYLLRRWLPASVREQLAEQQRAYAFLLVWIGAGYLGAPLLLPAVSYWMERVYLPLFAPGVLLCATILAAIARTLPERGRLLVVCAGAAFLLWASGEGTLVRAGPAPLCHQPAEKIAIHEAIEWLKGRKLSDGTRIYATPNQHLAFMLYAGLPVQSVAPVRKAFLDSYEGEVIIFECARRYPELPAGVVQEEAAAGGVRLTREEAEDWADRLSARLVREDLEGKVSEVSPPLEPLPSWAEPLALRQRQEAPRRVARSEDVRNCPALFRGFELSDFSTWWPIYFYRFSDPESRMGNRLNYAERVRTGRATVLGSSWIVYEAPRSRE